MMKIIREFLKLLWPDLDDSVSNGAIISAFIGIIFLIIIGGLALIYSS